jgi:cytoskeletal protein RodZ
MAMATLLSDSSGNGRTSHTRTHENDGAGLGELLRRARERRGLTLEQISLETKIPQRHLKALEHDNLASVPGGFYRRAEIRTYARAVNLDQNLALAQLERALEPPVAREAVPETPRTQEPTPSPKRLLIAIGVVVAAAVFGRATGGREPALDGDAHVHRATDSPQHRVPPVRETPPDAVIGTSQRTQLDQVEPSSVPPEGALAVATEPQGARASASSNGDVAVTPKQAEARASAASVTELVVTTQPAGARVTVNGIGWGIAPVTIRYLPAGDKRIRVTKEGYSTEERVVPLAEGHLDACLKK